MSKSFDNFPTDSRSSFDQSVESNENGTSDPLLGHQEASQADGKVLLGWVGTDATEKRKENGILKLVDRVGTSVTDEELGGEWNVNQVLRYLS